MKKKILIGSIFAALLLLSMPFVSTLQAAPVLLDEGNIVESTETTGSKIFITTYTIIEGNVWRLGNVKLVLKNDGVPVRIGRTSSILGTAVFVGLPSGSYTVTASAQKCKTITVAVDFGDNWIEMVGGEPDNIEDKSKSIYTAFLSLLSMRLVSMIPASRVLMWLIKDGSAIKRGRTDASEITGIISVRTVVPMMDAYVPVGGIGLILRRGSVYLGSAVTGALGNAYFSVAFLPGVYSVIAFAYGFKTKTVAVCLGFNQIVMESSPTPKSERTLHMMPELELTRVSVRTLLFCLFMLYGMR